MGTITLFEGTGEDLNKFAAYSLKHNREIIFIESLQELCNLRGIKSPYSLVRKGSILRFLLLSESGYYNIINREYGLKIKFKFESKFNNTKKTNLVNNQSHTFSINELNFNEKTEGIPIGHFLNQIVMINTSESNKEFIDLAHIENEYSIKTIIDLIANGHGGVHIETSWNKRINISNIFSEETSPLNINFNSRLHDIIDAISIITIEAMIPLVEKINSQPKKPVEIVLKAYLKNNSDSTKKK